MVRESLVNNLVASGRGDSILNGFQKTMASKRANDFLSSNVFTIDGKTDCNEFDVFFLQFLLHLKWCNFWFQ